VPGWDLSVSTEVDEAGTGGDDEGANHGESNDAGREACSGAVFCAQSAQGTGTRHTAVGMSYQDYVLTSIQLDQNGFANGFDVWFERSYRKRAS
jgi:hypothetical protein